MPYSTEFSVAFESEQKLDPTKLTEILQQLRNRLNELVGEPPKEHVFDGLYEHDDWRIFDTADTPELVDSHQGGW